MPRSATIFCHLSLLKTTAKPPWITVFSPSAPQLKWGIRSKDPKPMRGWFCMGWIGHRSWEKLPGHLALVPIIEKGKVISHRLGRDCGTIYGAREEK
ncbi:hypothetical protein L1987_61307 [Smallanthus sonchifolius]|uniref:Uncharacterized protein n=1 Tax=Smallanthus sonchifolius TaxID=185202 RepID=A0ACB9DAP8_9ASTR|nr:hypothetical protein L1987_61307 [Smallanthus sonchifolius]